MEQDAKKIAYFREFSNVHQVELMFPLRQEIENVGVLEEDVKAVRQSTDTVDSLLKHIVNKINKSIKELKNSDQTDEVEEINIHVELINPQTRKRLKPNTVLKNIVNRSHSLEFRIFNHCFIVLINAPLVKHIKLPPVLYSNFVVQPSKLHILFTQKDSNESLFFWHKSRDKENWTQVANTYKYTPLDEDVDFYLKLVCVPRNCKLIGPPAEAVSENPVYKMGELPACPFEARHKFTKRRLENRKFRVVSYNVLSSRYTDNDDQFSYCPPKALSVDYRKQLVAKELLGYQADIICLQEVDSVPYTGYYKDVFKQDYMSFYHRKGNRIPEGLACIFNKNRFKKLDCRQLVFSEELKTNKIFSYLWNSIKSNSDLVECFMRQCTSLQVTILKERHANGKNIVIVANSHLYYHPDCDHIRLLQVNMATTYINYLKRFYSNIRENVSVVFCGDFNSTPSSVVYSYLIGKRIDNSHEVSSKLSKNIDLFHNFLFESACGQPKFTNYTESFKGCLDYIFVERNKVRVEQVVPFPTEGDLAAYRGLPNEYFPSDHLALVADLEFI